MIMNTNMRKPFERLLAIALSFAMLLSLLPMTAFAESGASTIGVNSEIIAFEPLTTEPEFEGFTVSVALPDINVTVGESTGTVTAFAELSDEIRWQNTAQPMFPETVSGAVYGKPAEIPVTWKADHAYDAELPAKGLYVFDAVLGNSYILAEDVETPRITVYIPKTDFSIFRMGGGGTAASPLEITNVDQLSEIAVLVNAGRLESFLFNNEDETVSLKLMNDLDLFGYSQSYNDAKGWVPIGNGAYPFKGNFDGDGHTISGLYIDNTNVDNAGLFGCVSGGSITSLSLSTVNIHAGDWVGAIAGYIDEGDIENCRVNGTVSGGSNIGGVVGWVDTSAVIVKACSFAGMVSGSTSWTGGVAGRVSGGLLQRSYSTATVNGSYWVGGVVGAIEDNGTVEYCYATGAVKGSECVGGIAGMNGEYCNLQNCAALNSDAEASTSDGGRVAGANYMGTLSGNVAFSGMMVNGSIVTSIDYTDINGADMTAADIKADGSIATRFTDADGWTIENGKLPGFGAAVDMPVHIMDGGYFTGEGTSESPYEISTPVQLAKLAELVNTGDTNYNSNHYKLTADIDLSAYGASYNGGRGWKPIGNDTNSFMGKFDGNGKAITGLYINDDTLYAAGLFGEVKGSTIENLSVSGSVSGGFCVGVLAGALKNNSEVKNCHTTGNVNAGTYAGGLVGTIFYIDSISGGTISSCYSTATVAATQSGAGGILGGGASGTIEYCAALNPSVGGPGKVGRIMGENDPSNGITLTGNAAFSGMTVTEDNSPKTPTSDATGIDGADVTADALQAVSGFPSALTAAPWTYQSGSLPGLFGKTVEMPAHITNKLTNFFAGGTGGQFGPYEIATPAQLVKLAELVNAGNDDYKGKYYRLTADIDLSAYGTTYNGGKGWVPIGHDESSFYGNFNGSGKTITGLYISDASRDYAGLFGYITTAGNVHDLVVKNAYINAGGSTGIVAGYTSTGAWIERCFVSGTVNGSVNVGGVAGYVKDSSLAISQCAADVAVSGTNNIGGVVGTIDSAVVQNCYATGNVSGTGYNIGGIGGNSINGSALKKCYATCSVSSVSGGMYVGGIAGYGQTIENCVALGKSVKGHVGSTYRVTGYKSVGGNNYAFSAMTGSMGLDKTTDNVDGADVTVAQASTLEFWTTAGNWYGSAWDDTLWTITDGKLPMLKNLPANLQSGDGGLYLIVRDIANAKSEITGGPYIYTGNPIEPSLSVTFDGATLVKGKDYTVTYSDNTNAGQATVTLSGIGNFTGAKTTNFIIVPKILTTAVLKVLGGPFTYTGKQQKPNVTLTCDGKTLTLDKDYEVTYGSNTNAGATVSVSAEGKGNYIGYVSTNPFTISRAELTVIGIAAKAYDGATRANGLALTFKGLQNGEELGLGVDYAVVDASFNSADAGTDKTVTGTVALNYTAKANNYSLANGTLSLTGQTISKASISDVTVPVYVPKNYATTLTTSEQEISAVLKDLTNKDLGSITWSIVSVDNDDAVLATIPSIGVINFPLSIDIASVADAGKTATIKVKVSSMNYVDFAASMTITVLPKEMVTIGGITTPDKTYDGTAFEPVGTIKVTGGSVPMSDLLWNYKSTDSGSYYNATPPTNAGDYELVIRVSNKNANYIGEETFAFAIEKRQITLTADNKSVIKGGSLPELTYTVVNLAPGKTKADALTTEPTLGCPTFDANTLGSYPITLTGGTATDNYTITARTNGVLTVAEQTYTVTFKPNGGMRTGGGDLTQTVAKGSAATAPILSRSNYTFISWDKPFDNVTSNLTVTANWSYNGGGGNGGGGGGSVVTPPAEQPKTETTTSGNTATATITATAAVNDSGTATAAATQAQISEAITKAAEAAAKQGGDTAAIVEIKVTAPANTKTVETSIPKAAMELAADGKTAALTVSTPVASLSFDTAALATIAGEAAGDVKITASRVEASTLSAETQQLIGDRPVFNFSVTSGGQTISQFGGSVSVSAPYTPKAGEDLNAIVIYYINGAGKPEVVSNCSYDPATGTISFKTSHFSKYAVGYNKVTFKDVAENAWYGKAVCFIAARGVTTGTGNGNYSPDAKLTRGEFIVMLMKAYGIAPDTASADNFADAGSTYYTGYLAAAKRLGISGGVGNNMFASGKEITRQEMFTLLYNALKAIGELRSGNTGKSLSAFSDAGQIASWAKDAMALMVNTGTVSGSGGKLTPEETTTRAQMAQVLYNLMSK